METRSKIGIIAFSIITLIIVVGGYFLMNYFTHDITKENNKPKEEYVEDLRIDKTKDYIYYENGEELISSEEIHRDEAILNFKTLTNINEQLRQEEKSIYDKSNIKYTKDYEQIDESAMLNEEGIYSLKYRNYENYKFQNYVSLVITDFNYDIVNGTVPYNLKSYVVGIKDGHLYTEEELLEIFSINKDTIKSKIKERLTNTQVLDQIIEIDATMNDLHYVVYVGKNGKLQASFIVKTKELNYNDYVDLT